MGVDFIFLDSLSSIDKSQYSKLINEKDAPFIQYSFLDTLEKTNCVGSLTGWKSNHLAAYKKKTLSGILPLYIKDNSHGEFVFDHSWSYALTRAGRNYYPKLLTCIPFTPCETRKFITEENSELFIDEVLSFMNKENIETWHILYPDFAHEDLLKESRFIERNGYKFIWRNKQYSEFEDFLKIFKSRQRKNIKNERKKISQLNISFEIKDKNDLTVNDWEVFFEFYRNTYEQRLQRPYLNLEFFKQIHLNRKKLKPVIFFAIHNGKKIAGSLCFHNDNTLYGRHWGSIYDIDSLHFETCFYQGIEFCIRNNIEKFDPGVQGEHKIRRGFEPYKTKSFHYIKENDFRKAINDFCSRERQEIDSYIEACKRYTPFNKDYKI